MLKFNKTKLSAAVSAIVFSCLSISHTTASDLEIYSNAKQGRLTLFMMFDTSGSMGYGRGYVFYTNLSAQTKKPLRIAANGNSSLVQDYNVCDWHVTKKSDEKKGNESVTLRDLYYDDDDEIWYRYLPDKNISYSTNAKTGKKSYKLGTSQNVDYDVTYCPVTEKNYKKLDSKYKSRIDKECDSTGDGSYQCYDRLSRLKMALVQVLTSQSISDSTYLGIGQYASPIDPNNPRSQDGETGRILYPVVQLTQENRKKLLEKITSLDVFERTPSAPAYAESGLYLLGKNPKGLERTGFEYSNNDSKNDNGYIAPLTQQEREDECNGTGIYFLTDGYANNSNQDATKKLMKEALGYKLTQTGLSSQYSEDEDGSGWNEIGSFAKHLQKDKKIKTAVVGFGSLFPSNYSKQYPVPNDSEHRVSTYYDCSQLKIGDVQNTCNWGAKTHPMLPGTGGYGEGGFYSAQSVSDVVDSVNGFINDVKPRFEPLNVGSPTVPVDEFDPTKLQSSAYYSDLTPTPQESYQLWLGNLNKYQVINGVLADINGNKLYKNDGSFNSGVKGYWDGGVSGKLPLKLNTNGAESGRKILTNRNFGIPRFNLSTIDVPSILDSTGQHYTDASKGYLLNLLGFGVDPTLSQYTSSTLIAAPEVRQLGSILHSTPLVLAQSQDSTGANTESYLLFGTTQGLLHIVSTNSGKEVFSFVPSEMIEKQKKGFINKDLTAGELFYGIDGPWSAYSQRKSTQSGKLSVSVDSSVFLNGPSLLNKSLQWVYGGLRMGGKSYYALDLTHINKPLLKFNISPDGQWVANSKQELYIYSELGYMGQSWSKPTIGWVNFKGEKRLVMFVGGGYDTNYEEKTYKQDNGIGGGVYMFDANSGQLLWHTKNEFSKNAQKTAGVKSTYNENLQYSVVSQINAVDRDGDGLIDHLYFGDLGGQVFRIDIDNINEKNKQNYIDESHIVRLLDLHQDNGLSPRFYDMPTLTKQIVNGQMFIAVSIASGNRSSPLASANESAKDGVHVIYDHDVVSKTLFNQNYSFTTKNVTLQPFNATTGVPLKNSEDKYNGGWSYIFPKEAGRYKAINGLYAAGNILRVNVYDKDGGGISGKCGAGVKGDTGLMNFCLPTGKCNSGVVTPEFKKISPGFTGTSQSVQDVGGKTYITTTGGDGVNPFSTEPKKYGAPITNSLTQLKWYEK